MANEVWQQKPSASRYETEDTASTTRQQSDASSTTRYISDGSSTTRYTRLGASSGTTPPLIALNLNSSLGNLSSELTVNSITQPAEFFYQGQNATLAGGWESSVGGETLTLSAGSNDPTYERPIPVTDGIGKGVLFASSAAKAYQPAGTALGDVDGEDFVCELIFRHVDGAHGLMAKYNYWLGTSNGWGMVTDGSGNLRSVFKGPGGALNVTFLAGAAVGCWMHWILFADKSGSVQNYINGVATGSAGNISALGSFTDTVNLSIGGDSPPTIFAATPIAHAAMWKRSAWLDTHLQAAVAASRFYALTGLVASDGTEPSTYTRASTAHIDIVDAKRNRDLHCVYDHWPALARRADIVNAEAIAGLIVEPQTTNVITESEDFSDAAWTKTASSITADSALAPDGYTTADTFTEDAATSGHHASMGSLAWGSNNVVVSCWAKPLVSGGRRWLLLQVDTTAAQAWFDIESGLTISTSGAQVVAAGCEFWGNGWYRNWLVAAPGGTGTAYIGSADANGSDSFAGLNGDALYIWGAMAHAGDKPVSYIKTDGATASRVKDVLEYTATTQAEGTLHAEYFCGSHDNTAALSLATLSNGGASADRITLEVGTDDAVDAISAKTAGNAGAAGVAGDMTDGAIHAARATFESNSLTAYRDGVAGTPDTTVDIPTFDTLHIGMTETQLQQASGLISNVQVISRVVAGAIASRAEGFPVATYGEMYVTSAAATTLTPGTPLLATSTTATGELLSFTSPSNFRLRYDAAQTGRFHVDVALSMTTSANNTVVDLFIAKNGTELAKSKVQRKVGTGADLGAAAITAVVELAQTDYLELFIDADAAGTMTIEACNFNVQEIQA